jgi:two-component system alkaline phosphatase synthesis response regulator PhoP
MDSQKILIVDDESDILEFLSYNLRKEGFEVFTCSNGVDALETARKEIPDLILLDVMMPEMDGIETCQEMNKIPELDNTFKIFLTARSEDYSQIAGFEAGADDYVNKPIKPKVLISRIKAILRRGGNKSSNESQNTVSFGDIVIDKERYIVLKKGQEYSLPKKEFELLLLLSSKPGKVFERSEILSEVWGKNVIVGDRTIDVHIRKLRDKLQIDNIITVKGVGYKIDA